MATPPSCKAPPTPVIAGSNPIQERWVDGLSSVGLDLAAAVRAPSSFCTMSPPRANAASASVVPVVYSFDGNMAGIQYLPAPSFAGPSYEGFSFASDARGGELQDAGVILEPAQDEVLGRGPRNGRVLFIGGASIPLPTEFFSTAGVCYAGKPPMTVDSTGFDRMVQYFKGHMVLGRGWEYFCSRHKIVPDNLVVFKLSGLGLKMQIFNANSSNIYRVRCSKHSCVGDIAHAI